MLILFDPESTYIIGLVGPKEVFFYLVAPLPSMSGVLDGPASNTMGTRVLPCFL